MTEEYIHAAANDRTRSDAVASAPVISSAESSGSGYRRSPWAAYLSDDRDVIVLPTLGSSRFQPLRLEGSAAVIWNEIVRVEQISREQLLQETANTYRVSVDEVEAAVDDFTRTLIERGLIEFVDVSPARDDADRTTAD